MNKNKKNYKNYKKVKKVKAVPILIPLIIPKKNPYLAHLETDDNCNNNNNNKISLTKTDNNSNNNCNKKIKKPKTSPRNSELSLSSPESNNSDDNSINADDDIYTEPLNFEI